MSGATDYPVETLVRAGQVRLAYSRMPQVLTYSLVVSLLFTLMLVPVFPAHLLWPGLIAVHLMTGVRAGIWVLYRRAQPAPDQWRIWIGRFMLGVGLGAAAWSAWIFNTLRQADAGGVAMLLIALMAVSAVAVYSLVPYFPSLLLFLGVVLGPTAAFLLLGPEVIVRITGAAMLAGMATLLGAGWRMQDDIRRMLRTEIELSTAMELAVEARRVAESASQAKSLFLANMSHEVRTPLNGILGLTELIKSHHLAPEQRNRIRLLQSSTTTLLNIVNDILDFSKIEAGKLDIEQVEFDLHAAVDDVAQLLAARARGKGIDLSCFVCLRVPDRVIGDPVRVGQVLTNLGANAVKFTAKGRIRIQVERAPAERGDSVVRFTVSDTGIGMSVETRARLFTSFTQADSSTTRRFGGTGLGLSISHQLVNLMGGAIGVDSVEGEGSSFWFDLPLPEAANQPSDRVVTDGQSTAAEAAAPASESPARRILLVEDHEINQMLAMEVIRGAGYEVDLATNGQEAVDARFSSEYGLLLMDCQMPVLDGFEATRRIREREAALGLRRIPIVALTANAVKGDRDRCVAAGMDDYLPKPFKLAEILDVISRHLEPASVQLPESALTSRSAATIGGRRTVA